MITLSKPADRDFLILNLTDIHLTNEEWAPEHPFRRIFTETVRTLVERVQPDLITITGDLTMVNNERAYEKLADFLEGFNVPWAPVWGNHDNENPPELIEQVVERYRKYKHFVYESGDPSLGNGNYVIGIEENGRPVTSLILFDSHNDEVMTDESGTEHSVYAKLYPAQINWYCEQVCQLKDKGYAESMMLLHTPIYAYNEAFDAAFSGVFDEAYARSHPELFAADACWNKGYKDSTGIRLEVISSYPADDGVFDVVTELKHTKLILAGHDHINNWMIRYQDVLLAYALKTGASAYWTPELNGGTVIRISSDGIRDVYHEFVKTE